MSDISQIVEQHRKLAKNRNDAEAAEGETRTDLLSGAQALQTMADRSRDELIPLIFERLAEVLRTIEDVEAEKL